MSNPSAGCLVLSLPQWLDPVPAHRSKGFLSEKAASIWHGPDAGLAQSTWPRFKATHTPESEEGATLVSECTGASVAKCWPFCPGHRVAFVPSTLGDCSPSATTMLHSDYYHMPGPFLLLPFCQC